MNHADHLRVIDVDAIDGETRAWMAAAAQGAAPWICSDCGASFPNGMPDQCIYGHQSCTDIITRDKARARAESA